MGLDLDFSTFEVCYELLENKVIQKKVGNWTWQTK